MGDPTDPSVNHGPQADEIQYNLVKQYIELGKRDGELILGGGPGVLRRTHNFTRRPENAQIMKEEIFGPVVSFNVFEEADVIRLGLHAGREPCNANGYGYGGGYRGNQLHESVRGI
ncbi:hypothetical protein BJX68DRAFT_267613 [Aspergillus pseudodeflectus]|uniref:Aldehyde dehydrogenase domain-containing protein n=1 Tax=Aspergillus pseudodeflectus TaxID=176178 RepID=A0ABR4K9R0_9EURO